MSYLTSREHDAKRKPRAPVSDTLRAVRLLRRAVKAHGVTAWTLERSSTGRGQWACMALRTDTRAVWHYHRDPVEAARRAVAWARGLA